MDEQPVKEPEVAAGDAGDCGDGLADGEAGVVQGAAELAVKPQSAGYRSTRAGRAGPTAPGGEERGSAASQAVPGRS